MAGEPFRPISLMTFPGEDAHMRVYQQAVATGDPATVATALMSLRKFYRTQLPIQDNDSRIIQNSGKQP